MTHGSAVYIIFTMRGDTDMNVINSGKRLPFIILLAFTLASWVSGCAPPFSRQALDQVDRNITLAELQRDPDRYIGKWIMLGGVILGTKNTKEGSFIEVLQRPVGRRGRPVDTDTTEGRFLVASGQFLDSAVYHAGRQITVIGEAAGLKVQPLGEIPYRYPVVKSRELQMWEPSPGSQLHFGVGLGVYHRF